MKLFDDYEAFRFPEENQILITRDRFLYYIYRPQYKHWYIHTNRGSDQLTVSNYPDISRDELAAVMGGSIPEKETDILRLLFPHQLSSGQMMQLLEEDCPEFMSGKAIYDAVRWLFHETDTELKLNDGLKELFATSRSAGLDHNQVLMQVRELGLPMAGRDIFRKEIQIIDGHMGMSYFHIHPVRIIDSSNTENWDNIGNMESVQIAIEEDDVANYLVPFIEKHFDNELEANRNRIKNRWTDNDGKEHVERVESFEWYATYNFFTHGSIARMLDDINDTILDLACERDNEFIAKIRKNGGFYTYETIFLEQPADNVYTDTMQKTEVTSEQIIDFYRRFIYRMEYMMKIGKEKGYDLISFMGP